MRRAIIPIIILPAGLTALYTMGGLGIKPSPRIFGWVWSSAALISCAGLSYLLWRQDRRLRQQITVEQRRLMFLSKTLSSKRRVVR